MNSAAEKNRRPARLWLKIISWGAALCLLLLLTFIGVGLAIAWVPMGQLPEGTRLARIEQDARYSEGKFHDTMKRVEPDPLEILPKWFEAPVAFRRPTPPMNPPEISASRFKAPPASGTRITWLGHSTLIVEIAGKRLLIDPVWGEYVAPLELKNAKRFFPPLLPLKKLPKIDAVLISHDHYDHLDYPTVQALSEMGVPFYVPLGIGAHLEYWGVNPEKIFEHSWWQDSQIGELTLVCSPARHFSGRSLPGRDKTLWAGWAILGPSSRLYYTGDTALFPGFKEIGERYGPFDATMVENGAYNAMWADVHLGPEQAVQAHKMLGGKLLIPVHWGLFDLGLHAWTEPMERILVAAEKEGVQVASLRPGQSVEPAHPPALQRWWPKRPWKTAEETPVVSSGL